MASDPYAIAYPILVPEVPPPFRTLHEFKTTLYLEQRGLCALCHRTTAFETMVVEHDHETGHVRGLVCRRCNTSIVGANTQGSAGDLLRYLTYPAAERYYSTPC